MHLAKLQKVNLVHSMIAVSNPFVLRALVPYGSQEARKMLACVYQLYFQDEMAK